jgi:uncharacterized protein (TIGR02145 family)
MKKITLLLFGFYCTNVQSQNVIADIDGNLYKTVKIGEQVWMAENLKVSHYRNGDSIPTNLSDSLWMKSESGSFTIYNRDSTMNKVFGKLYNWYAVVEPRGLCPVGWHVPSNKDWKVLQITLGLDEKEGEFFKRYPMIREIFYGRPGEKQNIGGKMKSIGYIQDGTGYWKHKPNNETNESGFSGLPGGAYLLQIVKSNNGYKNIMDFRYSGDYGSWWSSTEVPSNSYSESKRPWLKSNAWYFLLDEYKRPYQDCIKKSNGMSVRCLKD